VQGFKKWLRYFGAAILLIGAIVGIEILLEQPMGLFSGSRPADLGFTAGKFKPCPWKPNCVSSTAPSDDAKHYIEPLKLIGPPEAGWKKLKDVLASTPRVKIIAERPGYLYAEFKTPAMGFVDDVEFALDASAQVMHVRSASRLGTRDFAVNRTRIESIRKSLAPN
jgi:Uncharacterized protein conserved in bacteria